MLGSRLLGWRTVGYVEFDDYCQQVLAQRITDGFLDEAPIFGDVRAFVADGYAGAYSGLVDVVSAGFPCQPFSVAGKRRGEADERDMWPATLAVLREVRPRFALLENVPGLLGSHGYFGRILGGLDESGFDAEWDCIPASSVSAPHQRDRLFVVAHARRFGGEPRGESGELGESAGAREGEGPEWERLRDAARDRGEVLADADRQRELQLEGTLSPSSGDGLATAVRKFPTPKARDWKGQGLEAEKRRFASGRGMNLGAAALLAGGEPTPPKTYPTPRSSGSSLSGGSNSRAAAVARGTYLSGSLHPCWVEWLQGFPVGWTDLRPLETLRFRQWCELHGIC